MLLFFILYIIFIINIQFLLKNIFLDHPGDQYFIFYNQYLFPKSIAIESLSFILLCTFSLISGYLISRKRQPKLNKYNFIKHKSRSVLLLNTTLFLHIILSIYILSTSGGSYGAITATKKSLNFLYELRAIPLLLICHITLNSHPRDWLNISKSRISIALILAYGILAILLQARSIVFELFVCFAFAWLKWNNDKIRPSYIALLAAALIAPNILVLFRFRDSGISLDFIIENIFAIEYSVIFNNVLGSAIENTHSYSLGATFLSNLVMVIPSPIRSLIGLNTISLDIYRDIAQAGGVYGGGFSLFAEMYINFGWASPFGFLLIGALLGTIVNRSFSTQNLNVFSTCAPLIYSSFILVLRNDMGVFIKYVIQIYALCLLIDLMIRLKTRASTRFYQTKLISS